MKKYYLTILILFFALTTYANTPYFLRINSEIDGLSHNAIRCLLQDSRGYVWIGTQMGLNRYDGTRIKTFRSDKFPSAYIFSLCEDHKGNIWIGTGSGIVVYDYEYDRFFEPLKENVIFSVLSKEIESIIVSVSGVSRTGRIEHLYVTVSLGLELSLVLEFPTAIT